MKRINLYGKLGRDLYSLVDDEDYDHLMEYKWYISNGYAKRTIYYGLKNGKPVQTSISIHQEIMGKQPGYDIDHINGDKLDNRRQNLRVCLHSLNLQNRSANKNSQSGIKNIDLVKGKYRVRFYIRGKAYNVGAYGTIEEAITVRDIHRKELLREFA